MSRVGPSPRRLIVNQQHLRTEWSGGAGTYAEELVARLERDAADPEASPLGPHDLYVLQRPEEWDAAPRPQQAAVRRAAQARRFVAHWMLPPGVHAAARDVYRWARAPRRCPPSSPAASIDPAAADEALALEATAHETPPGEPWGGDVPCVLHELTSYEAHPLIGHICANPNVRLCVTFLDLQDFFYPEFFPPEAISSRRRNYAFYARHAALFFSISEFTKRTMVDLLGIDPDRIIVTPLAGDGIAEPASASPACALEAQADAAAKAHGRYLLYPAKPWWHKNHTALLNALGDVADVARAAGLRLLLTGGMGEAEKVALVKHAHTVGAGDLVEILGFRPAVQLHALLRNAEMMIFPSLFEGFGMPVLEAQAAGCPVACSNTTSLPEVAGDAAVLFDPKEAKAIAQVIADAARGRIDRDGLRERGFRNIRRFTWESCYRATAEGYERLFRTPPSGQRPLKDRVL